jgi:hypothetical protein
MMSIFSPDSSFTTAWTRVDAAVLGHHRDFGARARVAGNRLDLDDAVVDLRHLLREQAGHELGMGARQEDLRAARLRTDVVDIGAHPVLVAERLARLHLVPAQDRLGAAEIDQHVAVLDALDLADHDLADAVLVLAVLALALGLAHLLHDHLLGALRGDAAEVDRRQRLQDVVADLRRGIALARVLERDLRGRVGDLLGDLEVAIQPDVAGLAIDFGDDLVLLSVLAAGRGLDRLFHRDDHVLDADALLLGDVLRDPDQFQAAEARRCVHAVVGQDLSSFAPSGRPRASRRSAPAWPS